MIRAGKFALALFVALAWLNAAPASAQFEGPGGIVYNGQPCDPPAYIAGPGEPGMIDPAAVDQALYRQRLLDDWFIRAEYLNWDFRDLSDTLLGSPVGGVGDPRQPTTVLDPGSGAFLGTAIVPDTSEIKLRANNGFRVTTGAELLMGGRFEVNGFMLAKGDGNFLLFGGQNGVPNQAYDLIATSTFVNGQLAQNYETYNGTFRADFESRLWGAGADYFIDVDREGLFQFMPTVGARYINLNERLVQTGTFITPIDGTVDVSTIISKTWNNLAGAQIGFRQLIVTQWFSLGVDPRVGLGYIGQKAQVLTDNFQGGGDPPTESHQYNNHVSLFGEIGAWGAWNINPHLNFRVGYNFLWLNQVTRPEGNIYYNELDDGNGTVTTDVHVAPTRQVFSAKGVTVGLEYKW